MFIFSFHGSLLIGLPFPPSFVVHYFSLCEVGSDLVYIDVCSDLVVGDMCRIWLPTMHSEIFCSLSSLDVMAAVVFLVVCHISSWLDFVTDGRDFDCLPRLR